MARQNSIWAEMQRAKQKTMGKKKLSLKEALINYIAQDSVDTYDTGITILGLNPAMDAMINSTEFEEVLAGLGEHLSKNGGNAALIMLMDNNEPYLEWGVVSSYSKVGKRINEIELETQEIHTENGLNQPILIRYERISGSVVKRKIYRVDNVLKEVEGTRLSLPYPDIPVKIFKNNRLGKADIPFELHEALDTINEMSNGLPSEWYHSSVQFLNNMNFNSTKDGDTIQEEIESGKKVHDTNDPDGKLNAQTMMLSAGTQSPMVLWNLIEALLDKILMLSSQYRDMAGVGGTKNKQTLEVSGENKRAFEYMLSKLDWRQKQLQEALVMFDRLLVGIVSTEPSDAIVEIQIPELEQYKKDKQRIEIAKMEAEANAFNAQAEQYRAAAHVALNPPAQPEAPAQPEVKDGE